MSSHEGLSLEFVFLNLDFIFFIHSLHRRPFCNLSFYYKLAEVPGVACGILNIELKKTYNLAI